MVEFLRVQRPNFVAPMAERIDNVPYPSGTDVEAATAANYANLANTWKHYLRRNAEYLAWRREREPGYAPPDEPDPNDPENWTDERRRAHLRAERLVTQGRERI